MSADEDRSLVLRPASEADAQLLFAWRNDPLTRENSVNQDPVDWATHVRWLSDALGDPKREIMIAERGGQRVGMTRLDYAGGTCELSWSVAAAWRGKGIGKELVRQAVARVRGAVPIAQIKLQNEASTRIVRGLGFVEVEAHGDLVTWRRVTAAAS